MTNIEKYMHILAEDSTRSFNLLQKWSKRSDITEPLFFLLLLQLDQLSIVGPKIYFFYKDGCHSDFWEMQQVMSWIDRGFFNKPDVLNNLELKKMIPFFDQSIMQDEMPGIGEYFPSNPLLEQEYQQAQIASFKCRLGEVSQDSKVYSKQKRGIK